MENLKGIFDLAIYNRFRQGKPIAAELTPSSEVLRRWIIIFQPSEGYIGFGNVPDHIYNVLHFELEKEKVIDFQGDVDLIMLNKRRHYLSTNEELIDLLLDLRIDPKLFTYPWRCECPI